MALQSDAAQRVVGVTGSPALDAWTAQAYQRYEHAIAELLVPRLPGITGRDPRPRLLAALVMAAVRISLDDWIQHGGDLPALIHRALDSVSVET